MRVVGAIVAVAALSIRSLAATTARPLSPEDIVSLEEPGLQGDDAYTPIDAGVCSEPILTHSPFKQLE